MLIQNKKNKITVRKKYENAYEIINNPKITTGVILDFAALFIVSLLAAYHLDNFCQADFKKFTTGNNRLRNKNNMKNAAALAA